MSNVSDAVKAIQEKAENVSFVSEQTHEVNVYVAGRNVSSLTAANFKSANARLQNETVSAGSFDDEISAQQDIDSNWQTLRDYLENNLSSVSFFKTGTIQREIFAVGLLDGHIVGVRSFAIET